MNSSNSILIVDDDNIHRLMLRNILNSWGYQVFEADDGSTAIEQCQSQAFDLVLMDIRMKRVSGLEALGIIKSINPGIPVILMTAYSSSQRITEAFKSGASDYLMKPFDFDRLRNVVKQALKHKRQ